MLRYFYRRKLIKLNRASKQVNREYVGGTTQSTPVTTCIPVMNQRDAQMSHRDASDSSIVLLEQASVHAYRQALYLTVGIGGVLLAVISFIWLKTSWPVFKQKNNLRLYPHIGHYSIKRNGLSRTFKNIFYTLVEWYDGSPLAQALCNISLIVKILILQDYRQTCYKTIGPTQ